MSVNIDLIRLDGGTQSRAAINDATVADYAEAMADPNTVFPPVTVYFDGKDYWLADGFHRLAAWRLIGCSDIPADVRQGDRRSAVLHSVAANGAHGLRRTNEDKRRAVQTLLDDPEWASWSDREIGRRCAVNHELVGRLRAGFTGGNASEERTYTNRHGAVATMDTARIGRRDVTPRASNAVTPPAPPAVARATEVSDRPADVPPPEDPDPDITKARRDLRKLTTEALIDEVLGLRAALADERAKRRAATAERDEACERLKEFEVDDMGRALGNAQRRATSAEGRMKEHQATAARLQRRVNMQDAEIAKLRAEVESQVVPL